MALKTDFQGPGRVVQDTTYFQSELRQKINLLNNEIAKLTAESELINRENSNYTAFEKRADALATELRELQGQLGDLNTLVDKLHTDSDLADIERQCSQLKAKNERETQILDEIFVQRQLKENQIREIEGYIEEERQKSESQINDLDPEKKSLYFDLKEQNARYIAEVQKRQVELDDLHLKISSLQKRTLAAYDKLSGLRSKKQELEDSLKSLEKEAGPQEKTRLLEQVKEDNQETSAMERKIAELEEQSMRLKETLSQIELELDSHNCMEGDMEIFNVSAERNTKYEELLKRDKDMQAFIDSFEDRRTEFVNRNANEETAIVGLLDRIRVAGPDEIVLAKRESMPTQQEHKELQGDLKFKEKEMKNSENTMDAILGERDRRLQDLEKVNQLETKLHAELEHLKKKMETQLADMDRVSNLGELKENAEKLKDVS
ncbi:Intraflagellar transport protein 74 [Phlyctochytrium bullatum]|nr:Intraflagellar transport protein 74 [Phlyctochytrium bullatum]